MNFWHVAISFLPIINHLSPTTMVQQFDIEGEIMFKPERAGEEIRFRKGKYKGMKGWYDVSKNSTSKRVYVFVDLNDGTSKSTYVRPTSIAPPFEQPRNWAEYMCDQHPDIDGMIDNLLQEVAKVHLGNNMVNDDSRQCLWELMFERYRVAAKDQSNLGNKASWRILILPEDHA